ncbi:hypothetical protein BS333_19250 [Vibrio azureus]|uniref:Uncharacterized protein n=1 Tax=Vibrio azureus NBRC 104587 TaxID=1219077 RepID=U3ATH1_9VIBR|nr:hypothetical protein [Vibrio azureus]AUI88462.1 hypothetical protein BS333_19250 [Vibrio azureus]GAD77060.1 hypothetical protein VAZ01S_060_00100 [Vibrio azureus NBRC 104587]
MKYKLALTLAPLLLSSQILAENKDITENKKLFGEIPHELAVELNKKATIDVVSQDGKKHKVYIHTLYQTDNGGTAYDNYGNTYSLKGMYEVPNEFGNMVERSCTKAKLYLDPLVLPEVEPEDLPGPSCYIESSAKESDPNNNFIDKKDYSKTLLGKHKKNKMFGCKRFSSYAPPMVWSPQISVASHVGSTRYTIKTKIIGNTQVQSWARFYNRGWQNRYFYSSSTSFTTGEAAASVFMSYKGKPLGSAIQGSVC